MIKTAIIALGFLVLASCSTAPAPTRSNSQPFSIISEQADSAAGTLTLLIRISGPATQPSVKAIAESVIASRRSDYRHIIIKSYAEGTNASDAPFAISRLDDGAVYHRFNSLPETERIQTH